MRKYSTVSLSFFLQICSTPKWFIFIQNIPGHYKCKTECFHIIDAFHTTCENCFYVLCSWLKCMSLILIKETWNRKHIRLFFSERKLHCLNFKIFSRDKKEKKRTKFVVIWCTLKEFFFALVRFSSENSWGSWLMPFSG